MELTDEIIAKFRAMVKDAGRDPGLVKIDLMMPPEDLDALKRYRDKGINRVVAFLPSAKDDEVLPILDRWAELIRKILSENCTARLTPGSREIGLVRMKAVWGAVP